MKRMLIAGLACSLCLAMAMPAFATRSRTNALGAGSPADPSRIADKVINEKELTLTDSANTYHLPQLLVKYKNSVDVDDSASYQYGRFNIRYALTDEAVMWLYGIASPWESVANSNSLGDGTGTFAAGTPAGVAGYAAGQDPTNHQIGLGFGTNLGESLRLGADLSIGGARADGNQQNLHNNTLVYFGAGLGFDLGEMNTLDFGLKIRFGSFNERVNNVDNYLPDSLIGFTLLGRGEFQVHQIAKLVPYVRFRLDSRNVVGNGSVDNQTGVNPNLKYGQLQDTIFQLGTDLAISPAEKVLIQPGLGFAYRGSLLQGNAVGQENPGTKQPAPGGVVEEGYALIPYYGFGAEAKPFDWLTLRVGARQVIQQFNGNFNPPANQVQPPPNDQAPPSVESHFSTVDNWMTAGFGINLRGWTIDININPQFFNNAVFAVTGTGGVFGTDLAITYDW